MTEFTLHPRLTADTNIIGDLPLCRVLLAKEAIGPWIILVPRKVDLREVHHLSAEDQQQLMRESSLIAQQLEDAYQPDKINLGALGNLVPQLHLHHVARFQQDCAWPAPIWGNTQGISRTEQAQEKMVTAWQQWLKSVTI
jgi:diadenosine tetraphosphate (Ap4A) HIT family hydrolase